jgi:hypothetical protein
MANHSRLEVADLSRSWVSTDSLVDERHTPALCHLGEPLSAFRKRCAIDQLARLNDDRLSLGAVYQGIDRTVFNRQFVADWFGCGSHFRFLFRVPVISATVIVFSISFRQDEQL